MKKIKQKKDVALLNIKNVLRFLNYQVTYLKYSKIYCDILKSIQIRPCFTTHYWLYLVKRVLIMNQLFKNIPIVIALVICMSGYVSANGPDEKGNLKKERKTASDVEYFETHVNELFHECALLNKMSYQLFKKAVIGYYNMKRENLLKGHLLTIIDFRQSSDQERLYIIDMDKRELIERSLVAHGKNSGNKYPVSFSNVPESNKSSIGFYVTAETYIGENGLSLKIDGKDFPFNTNVRKRNIVIHGCDYVSDEEIKKNGLVGKSEGCPALPWDNYKDVINMIKGGNCLFIYSSDPLYQSYSSFMNFRGAVSYYISEI